MVLMLAGLILALAGYASAQLDAVSAEYRRADIFGVWNSSLFHVHFNPDDEIHPKVTYFAGGKAEGKQIVWRPTAHASSDGSGRVDVFYTTEDAQLYHKWLDGGTFKPDASEETLGENLNGSFRGTVSATSFKADQIDLIAQGTDGAYYYRGFEDGKWQPDDWASIGGNFYTPPTSVRVGREVHVFGASRVDYTIKHKTWDGTRWLPSQLDWDDTPAGLFRFPPRAVSWGDGRLDVFVAENHTLWRCAWVVAERNCTDWADVGRVGLGVQPPVAAAREGVYEMLYPYNVTEGWRQYARKQFQGDEASDWIPQPNWWPAEPAVTAISNRTVLWFALAAQGGSVSLALRGWNGEEYVPTEDQWGFLGTVASGETGMGHEGGMKLVGQTPVQERLSMELK